MSIESLKEEARRHEQREEWSKALDLYMKAVEKMEDQENPDIALLNRVGDLQVRLGDVEGAVSSYQQAIGLYKEAELPNNAIAICRKIIRHAPRRSDPYLTMGQIRAEQGFVVDARQNYLTYAEKSLAGGDGEEALRALQEFVQRVPADVETRLFLAEQLASQEEKTADAVMHFRRAYQHLMRNEREEEAEAVAARLEELAPGEPLPEVEAEPEPVASSSGVDDALMGFESTSMMDEDEVSETMEAAQEEEAADEDLDFSFSEIGMDDEEAGDEAAEAPEKEAAGDPSMESFALDDAISTEDDAEDDTEDDFDFGDISLGGEIELEETEAQEEADAEEEAFGALELEGAEFEAEDDEDIGGELPTFGLEEEEAAEDELEDDILTDLQLEEPEAVEDELDISEPAPEPPAPAADPAEPETLLERDGTKLRARGEELLAQGDRDAGIEALQRAHAMLAREGKVPAAMDVVRLLIIEHSDDTALYQRLVEYGYQSSDRGLLIDAFLQMARALDERGEEDNANSVYQQVLNLDPGNQAAARALGVEGLEPAPAAAAPPPTDASDDEYVDLGSMVLDEDHEKSTRWVVSAQAPSGDEQADFAKMLSQFKEKVAENLEVDDAKAHYDLGTAYKEMGLLDEAIGEFQQSLRAEPDSLATYEMLGQCFLEKGEPEVAIRSLERARGLTYQVEDDLLGIYYFLGRSYQETGDGQRACEFYEKVFSLDINFKDVTERLRALR